MASWPAEFDRYVNHYRIYRDPERPANSGEPGDETVNFIDIDIGRKVGLQRVAIHHVSLPPHSRSSYPHAESLEEEFVYVLAGEPHVWIDGYVYPLRPGHAVGFPAGTGVAHTFINNTDSEVRLFVAGECTKKDNLCSFPVDPSHAAASPIPWKTAPRHPLGPHNGLPGPISAAELGKDAHPSMTFCPDFTGGRLFHYPGDSETFGTGLRISDQVGLKALGIWYEILPAARRSAFPHAHTHEEEFVYVLQGRPTVWLNGFTKELGSDEFAAFPANTGISHVVINDSSKPAVYLCVGESQEFTDEKLTYPKNPLRNREGQRNGWLWSEVPHQIMGPHAGRPQEPFADRLAFRLGDISDAGEVLAIMQTAPEFFQKTEGCLPSLANAQGAIADAPKSKSPKYFKEFLLIEHGEKPIGILDLHVHHPDEGVCYLGLLLLGGDAVGKGLGRRSYELAEHYIREVYRCKKVRLGIANSIDVAGFWKKLGFAPTGRGYDWRGENGAAQVIEYDKSL